jgi:DNA-binding NarL/FixJ family response regulator
VPVDEDITVLIVDDQPRFLAAAAAVVERTPGFRVVGRAADGADGIEQARALAPALVLMDINMPVLDGISACRVMTADSSPIIVILLSTYDRDDLPDGFATSGASDYLHKEELDPEALRRMWAVHGAGSVTTTAAPDPDRSDSPAERA